MLFKIYQALLWPLLWKSFFYKHALQLHKIYNDTGMGEDWIQLNFNQNFSGRLTKFITTDTSRYKIGKNRMSNRLRVINNEIELSDLNKSYNAFKMLMKKLYLSGTPITWNKNSTFRNHEAQTLNKMNDQNLLRWYSNGIIEWTLAYY